MLDADDPAIRAVVIGDPIAHSKSPAMLDAAFAATGIAARMGRIEAPAARIDDVIAWLRARPNMLGASVTLPHKLRFVTACDELSPEARAIGAVNCVHLGPRWVGHNTDAPGFADALAAAGFAAAGKHAVLLGAGGAARGVAYALRDARTVEIVARRPSEGQLSWTDAQLRACFARADLVVDCTPAGLDPATDAAFTAALPLDVLPSNAWIATLVYHRRTALLERATERGYSTLDGRAMLVHQAARAFEIWTRRSAPIAVMSRALDDALVKSA